VRASSLIRETPVEVLKEHGQPLLVMMIRESSRHLIGESAVKSIGDRPRHEQMPIRKWLLDRLYRNAERGSDGYHNNGLDVVPSNFSTWIKR
jgi:hypothetical protein